MPYSLKQETGRPVKIKDEGLTLVSNVKSIDFTGAGVEGSSIGSDVTEDIKTGAGGDSVWGLITGTLSDQTDLQDVLDELQVNIDGKQDAGSYLTSSSISDAVYGAGWNGDTTHAASKNALYDKIEGLPGGHDAVTLDVNADTLLSLSTQELGLDTQTANKVFAGPVSGAVAVPTFRSLVAADIAANLINDTHIDWGTGANQVSSCDIPDHDSHTIRDTFVHIVNRGVAETITVTLTGGLGISWTSGEIYDYANRTFVSIDAGSGNVTNTAVNYLKWVSGTTLTLSTIDATGNEVLIAIGTVYDGIINGYREMSLLDESSANIRRCARAVFPTRVTSGMSVHEDTDVTNPLDVTMDAGVYCKELTERITPVEIKSRNTAMVRHFHTGGVWDSDTNAQIETTNYDNGTQKTAIPSNKWVKGVFIYMNGKIGFVYPIECFSTIAEAQEAALPAIPTGLEPVPKLTAIVYQQGASDFTTAVWQDVRAGLEAQAFTGVSDHGALAGLSDDDHPQYVKDSEFTQNSGILVGTGAGTFQEETGATLRTSIGCAAIDQTMYIGTTAVAINRGTAALTLAGITLTTPDIGTPSAGTLTNCSFPTLNQNTTGSSGSCTGNSATVTNATLTTALTVNTGTLTLTAAAANNSVLTIGAGAVSVSGSNTGDQTTVSGNAGSATVLETGREINGVSFNGSANITVTAAADTLTTTTLKSTVVTSSLTSVGTLTGLTMSGAIQLGETSIKLDATLSADAKWSGITTSGVSGVTTLAIGDLIYLNANDGRWELADSNLSDGYDKQLGIALTAAADGAALEVLVFGKVRSAVFPAFTKGSPLYMSETAGDITHTAPTTTDACIRLLGFALTAEDFFFNPDNTYLTHT